MSTDPRSAIHALAALLDADYRAPIRGGEVREGGVRVVGYYDYDERVYAGLAACQELAGTDYDYLAHIERIEQQPIARATLEDLSAWFTWVLRGERFCDGHIAENLESGRVRALVTRLLELSPAG